MGSMREIRARIKSVKNTQQITKAMKMVASAKLRRTQKGLGGIRTFAQQSRHILSAFGRGKRRVRQPVFAPPGRNQKGVLCGVRGEPGPVRRV